MTLLTATLKYVVSKHTRIRTKLPTWAEKHALVLEPWPLELGGGAFLWATQYSNSYNM